MGSSRFNAEHSAATASLMASSCSGFWALRRARVLCTATMVLHNQQHKHQSSRAPIREIVIIIPS